MRLKRKAAMAAVILVCFLLQSTVFQALSIGGIAPNLLLIAAVSFGFLQGRLSGMWIGFVSGLLLDLFYGELLGFYAMLLLCIGYGAGFCNKIFYEEEVRIPLLLVGAGDLLFGAFVYGAQFLLRGRVEFLYYLRRIMIPEMIYTVLAAAVLYRLLCKLDQWLTELEMKERDSIWLRK